MREPGWLTGEGVALLEALKLCAAEIPEAPAILVPGRLPLTFGSLWCHIESLARALACRGIGPNDAVASVLPDAAETLCAFLGVCAVAGFAPLDPNLPDAEFESCLEALRPTTLLVPAGSRSTAARVAEAMGIPILEVGATAERGAGFFTLAGIDPRRSVSALEAQSAGAPAMPEPSCLALLLQTSATTGRAKFVGLTHANLGAMARASGRALMLTHTDRFLSMMPLFHLQGMLSAFEQLMVGGSVVCVPAFDADCFTAWIDEFKPTWYTAGPALHRAILALRREEPENTGRSRLRFVRSIGSAMPAELRHELEESLHVPIVEGYGLTEVGAVTSTPLAPYASRPGSAGVRIVPDVEIMDDAGNLLPVGRAGEIVVRGPNVAREYRNDPETTRAAFRDGWFRTGDVGSFDDDGYLYVTGRIKEMINRGGEKILPGEIDEVLAAHPAVADAAAFGFPHRTLGEEAWAAVVLRAGANVTESELRQFAASRLAGFKIPRRFIFVDAIPKGATGKPQRHKVAEMARHEGDIASERPSVPPATALENTLASIWLRVLEIEYTGLEDDFFALGGDSFALTCMLVEVETKFGAIVDPSEFFLTPTIGTLARLVVACNRGGEVPEPSPVFALQPRGGRVPFFCIPAASEDPFYFRHLARHLGKGQPFYLLRDPRAADERGMDTVERTAERFAQEMRRVQPQGPYALGGHCYGGIVAFELARQMSAAGDHIALLALFDTPTPGYPKVMRQWRRYIREARVLFGQGRVSGRGLIRHTRMLARLAWRYVAARLGRAAVKVRAKARLEAKPSNRKVANEVAGRIYAPRPFPGEAVAFLAAGVQHKTRVLDDSRLGWREFALGGLDVRRVAGMHHSMFAGEHVKDLAGQLTALLDPLNLPPEPAARDRA